jgi:hypothetical protein
VFGISVSNDFGVVPEPSTSLSLILGVGILGFFRRLRNESSARKYAGDLS